VSTYQLVSALAFAAWGITCLVAGIRIGRRRALAAHRCPPRFTTEQIFAMQEREWARRGWTDITVNSGGHLGGDQMSFTAASLAAARAVRDAFTVVGEVIDALIPAEATDQAEALAKAEEEHDFAACGGDAGAGSSHPTSAPSAKQDTAPHTDSETPPLGTPGGGSPHSAAGHPPGHLTSYDASWAAAIVQSRGLDLPLGSRARAAVLSLAERLDVLAKELA